VRVPDEEIGIGKVVVKLSFASWKKGNVADAALKVPIVDLSEKLNKK
jgi:hypothetical protein